MRRSVEVAQGRKEPGVVYPLGANQMLRGDEFLLIFQGSLDRHFPALSFREMIDGYLLLESFRNNPQFGIGGIDIFLDLPKDFGNYSSPPFYLVKIDWTYSNDTLAQGFKARLRPLRPTDQPEPKRPGRRGRTSLAPIDMLNQLAAFKLNRAGFTVSDANEALQGLGSRVLYQSGSGGWHNAITAAKDRIDRMLTVPFFNPPKRIHRKR